MEMLVGALGGVFVAVFIIIWIKRVKPDFFKY